MSSWSLNSFFLLSVFFLSFTYVIKSFLYKGKQCSKYLPPSPPGLPILGHLPLLGTLPYRTMHKWALKFGPVMQLQLGLVPVIVLSSTEAMESVFKPHDKNFSNRLKTGVSKTLIDSYGSKGLLFADYGPFLRDVRKLCNVHLLSVAKIDSFVSVRREEMNDFMKRILDISDHGREVVNITDQVGLLIERISCRMIFGNANYESERITFKPLVEESLRVIETFNLNDFFPFMKVVDFQRLTHRAKGVHRIFDSQLDRIIDQHKQAEEDNQEKHENFITSLFRSYTENGKMLDRSIIKPILMDLLGGSWESASTTIGWVLKELLKNPRVMKKVQEELTNVAGIDGIIQESDIGKLVYLDMVVKESMRLHPFLPLIPRESIEDVFIQGLHIVKMSRIVINVWAIGRDQNAWGENVEEFYPERFADIYTDVGGHNFQLIPFGVGRRQCPALDLGLRHIKVVLAQLLNSFNLELPKGISTEEVDMSERFGGKANPLFVVPTYHMRTLGEEDEVGVINRLKEW